MTSNDRENYFVLNCMISGVLIKIFNEDFLIFVAICSSSEVENPFHGHNFTDDSFFFVPQISLNVIAWYH